MKKGPWIIVAVAGLLAASYPGLAWYSGKVVESRLEDYRQRLLVQAPYLSVAAHRYERGIYRSHEEVTYEFGKQLLGALAAASAGSPMADKYPESLRITLRSEIEHGPFPKLGPSALARIETEFVMEQRTQEELAKAFGAKKPIEIVTLLDYNGGGVTTISSPSFDGFKVKDSTISWRGFKAASAFTRDLASVNMQGAAPGVDMRSANGESVKFEDMTFESKVQIAYDDLYVGAASAKLKSLSVVPRATEDSVNKSLSMAGLEYAAKVDRKDDFLDLNARFKVAELDANDFRLNDMHNEFTVKHLHGPSVAAFMKLLRKTVAEGPAGTGALATDRRRIGIEILKHDPTLVIDRISFAMPEGDAKMTGSVHVAGFKPEDLDGPGGPVALLPKLEATFDVSISETLFAKLAAAGGDRGNPANLEQALATLESQGYVTRKDGRLSSHMEYRNGQITVNGKPFVPPTPGATPLPPAEKPARDTTHT